jgi:hypothetical protein
MFKASVIKDATTELGDRCASASFSGDTNTDRLWCCEKDLLKPQVTTHFYENRIMTLWTQSSVIQEKSGGSLLIICPACRGTLSFNTLLRYSEACKDFFLPGYYGVKIT